MTKLKLIDLEKERLEQEQADTNAKLDSLPVHVECLKCRHRYTLKIAEVVGHIRCPKCASSSR